MLLSHEKPLIIFQQLQKEGRNPLFMLRYAGKGGRLDSDHRDDRDYRNGSARVRVDDDPTTPKSAVPVGPDGHGRYG
jgi:hypothetical protein